MEGLAVLLGMLAIGLLCTGPLAVILTMVLFNKIGGLDQRLRKFENQPFSAPQPSQPATPAEPARRGEPVWSGRGIVFQEGSTAAQPPVRTEGDAESVLPKPVVKSSDASTAYADVKNLIEIQRKEVQKEQTVVPAPVPVPPAVAPTETPMQRSAAPAPVQMPSRPYADTPAIRPSKPGGLELKIGTTVILIAGIITVIFGVGFFLKYVYDNVYFNPMARVILVAVAGLSAVVAGDISRRRNFEVVAKGVTSLGFALLYAAAFSGSRVYELYSTEWAFIFSILITAAAMAYAVVLNEILIAFLSLLGGFLAPVIISTGKNLPIPLFSYVLTLSIGAMGCAMFRRWRAVNWIAMTGTWFLYTAWFEKFYTDDQMVIGLIWLSIFAALYLVLPILHGMVRRIEARSEDVTLVVVNGVAVFYYLWKILNQDDQSMLAFATAILGLSHLVMMFTVIRRCRSDIKLQMSLGVLGIAFITASLPMYFAFKAALLGWAIEAVALTFIGIRYNRLWTQVMAFLVAGVSVAGLFYHLPLHAEDDFSVFLNAPFGTWLFVASALLICHALWRFMRHGRSEDASFASQAFYTIGTLLMAAGLALEWHTHCARHMVYDPVGQASFLKGMMLLAIVLVPAFLARPICPPGEAVRFVGAAAAVFGAAFTAIAMMGVYYESFKLFCNVPFGLGLGFLGILLWTAWQSKHSDLRTPSQRQLPSALVLVGLTLFFVLLTEQMYLYWSCLHTYTDFDGDWLSKALRYMFIGWAVYGLVLLFAGIRLDKLYVRQMAFFVTGLSAAGLFFRLPLHHLEEFQLVYNAPFMTWVFVTAAILVGHGFYRFMRPGAREGDWITQLYYAAGLFLLASGFSLEWSDHCRLHMESMAAGQSQLHLGLILMISAAVLGLLARPLPPAGDLVKGLGVVAALAGCAYTSFAMMEVYYTAFALFFNWPFIIAMLFSTGVLISAWFLRDKRTLAGLIMICSLGLIWVLLSEQVYFYWYCKDAYGPVQVENWSLSAKTYMSVVWAVYAAILIIIGFMARMKSIRLLSLTIFVVLLGKIFVVDMSTSRIEYRIAAFLTTGLILIGVAGLYQFLKNKGFFGVIETQDKLNESPTQ